MTFVISIFILYISKSLFSQRSRLSDIDILFFKFSFKKVSSQTIKFEVDSLCVGLHLINFFHKNKGLTRLSQKLFKTGGGV